MKIRVLFAALTAVLALSIVASTATALRSIEIGARTEVAGTSRRLTFEGEGTNVICEVTLNATLNASISKAERSAAGNAEARAANCERGTATPLNIRGGWPVQFKSFTGTLPRITSVRLILVGAAFLIEAFGGLGRCLYSGNAEGTTGPSEVVEEIRADPRVELPLFRNLGGFFCPERGNFRGTFLTNRRITLRLV